MSFLSNLFSGEKNPLETYKKELAAINSFKEEIEGLSQEQIQAEISNFKLEISKLETNKEIQNKLFEIRPRVFALIREAAKRSIGQFHYDVQLVGGIVLSEGKIAEMRTGEGKTL